jgi:hypothetical protein
MPVCASTPENIHYNTIKSNEIMIKLLPLKNENNQKCKHKER